jgi:CheY-like chemotaxis protein
MKIPSAARHSGATAADIKEWVRKGRVKSFKGPDGSDLVRLSEIQAYMRASGISGAGAAGAEQGRGAVLIVDDDVMVRGMIVQILKPLYPYYEARDGYEALRLARRHDDIGLVLLDIRMPGQSGVETYEQLVELRPDIAVVIVSGYIEDVPDSMMADNCVKGVVEKPVSEDLLLDMVAAAIEAG